MLSRYTMNATPTVTNIKDFKSSDETDETGRTINVNLSWVCETEPAESGWVVTYTLQDVETPSRRRWKRIRIPASSPPTICTPARRTRSRWH